MNAAISFYCLLFSLIFLIGCDSQKGRTPLESTTYKIEQGMDQAQITALFKDFEPSPILDFNGKLANYGDDFHKGVAFTTNVFIGYKLSYVPVKIKLMSFEMCTVYFNTNKTVMGYDYNLGH